MEHRQALIKIQTAYHAYIEEPTPDSLEQACTWLEEHQFPEEFWSETLESLAILVGLKADKATLLANFLCKACILKLLNLTTVSQRFGAEVAGLIEHLLAIHKVESKFAHSVKSVRALLKAGIADNRVVFIELTRKLMQLRQATKSPTYSGLMLGQEAMGLLAPWAHRLGVSKIKNEMEDLSFQILFPEEYQKVLNYYEPLWVEQNLQWASLLSELQTLLKKNGIEAGMQMRRKNLYSIYRKIERQKLSYSSLYDVLACRIITDDIPHCYKVLHILTNAFVLDSSDFKDFIQHPKPNGYESLHLHLISKAGLLFESQIRTHTMHHFAEHGIAGHWKYKYENKSDETMDIFSFNWVDELMGHVQEDNNYQDTLASLQSSLEQNWIKVYDSNRKLISLPLGSTVLDFAYAIHSKIGEYCQSAMVNEHNVSVNTQLKDKDQVHVVVGSQSCVQQEWLNYCFTSSTRRKIRVALKKGNLRAIENDGIQQLEKALQAKGLSVADLENKPSVQQFLKQQNYENLHSYFQAIGREDTQPDELIQFLQSQN